MKSSIAQDSPEKIIEFEKIMQDYTGDPRLLNIWLDRFGSDNPFIATSNAVLKRQIIRSREELKEETKAGEYVISESGHMLKNQLYFFTHKFDSTRIWKQGDTVVKIIEAFGAPEQKRKFTPEGREEILQRKQEQIEEVLKDIPSTLEEVLADPSKLKDVQSTIDRRKIQTILGLDQELKNRILALDKLVYGNTAFIDQNSPQYLVSAEKGGMFFGRFKRNLEKLPKEIRDIYTQLTGKESTMSEEDKKFYLGALIAWGSTNIPINREAALGGYQKDLDLIMNLPASHWVKEKYGEVDLTSVRHILKEPEITLIDATRVMDAYPVDEVRVEFNKGISKQYKSEIEPILKRIESLFLKKGKWREDMYGSVPMKRLREAKESHVLTRNDYDNLRQYMRTRILTQNNATENAFEKSMDIEQYKEFTQNVVVIARKLDYLEDKINSGEIVSDKLLKGDSYKLTETFKTKGMGFEELIGRLDKGGTLVWTDKEKGLRDGVKELAKFGLYSEISFKKLDEAIVIAKTYVKAEELETKYVAAEKVEKSGLKIWSLTNLPQRQEFFNLREQDSIEQLAAGEEYILEVEKKYGTKIENVIQEFNELKKNKFYTLKGQEIKEETPEQIEYKTKIGELSFYNLDNILEFQNSLSENYIKTTNINKDWFEKAELVRDVSKLSKILNLKGSSITNMNKFLFVDTYKENSYIAKDLKTEIESVYEDLKDTKIKGEESVLGQELKVTTRYNLSMKVSFDVKNEFKQEVGRFKWNPETKTWDRTNASGVYIANLSKKVARFNDKYNTNIKINVKQ